ncbi:hypothetical protein PSTEL_02320 [Paenibacillus stellifer]|uniref:Uncharacterized protein n=1 Tax=Paenibacillus stellifer TaxID=169760 RepID=A0A089LPV0_9BACL|nr:hypothetical protein [Paenibacillus stellifer]AIQ62130.1 hypothetical protein PSTEL_02320 [Paenibacillus stellifer]
MSRRPPACCLRFLPGTGIGRSNRDAGHKERRQAKSGGVSVRSAFARDDFCGGSWTAGETPISLL